MSQQYQCHKCSRTFVSKSRLKSHLKKKTPCTDQIEIDLPKESQSDRITCSYCNKEFARKDNLLAHLNKNRCPHFNPHQSDLTQEVKNPLAERMEQMTEL